ncbi:hypothetical protein [Achromobacter sp. E1]|uniref:hypothetical protein n=1 Tax=Achromobacter sp. E1 TaxID=3141581 RepID=UPI0030CA8879
MTATIFERNRIGGRVYSYLSRPRKQDASAALIKLIRDILPGTLVFGGMIRDMAFGSARDFDSDIDLVSLATRSEILRAVKEFEPQANKFGGFRFVHKGRLFDIWAFEDTWAFKEGLVRAGAEQDLCKTTFFNVDAVYQKLGSSKLVCEDSYLKNLHLRILDINLAENPSPEKIASRAIWLSWNLELALSVRLQDYVLQHASKGLWSQTLSRAILRKLERHRLLNENALFAPSSQMILDQGSFRAFFST